MWPGAKVALRVLFRLVDGRSISFGAQGAASAKKQEIGPRLGVQGGAGAKGRASSPAMWPGAKIALRVLFWVIEGRSIGLGAQVAASANGQDIGAKKQEINPAM